MEKFTRKGHEGVRYFIGPEIEQTPAFNKKTLFVVGLQDTAQVEKLAKEHSVKHIFLTANRSFDSVDLVNGTYMVGDTLASDWEKQIQYLLDMGYMVSIDYPAHKHVMVLNILNKGIWQSRNFVPILSVAVPHVNTSNPNLTIKIDDINFGATNPGVWCLNHHEVTDSNRFTSWNEYGDDVVLQHDLVESRVAKEPTRKIFQIDVGDNTPDAAEKIINTIQENMNSAELGLDPGTVSKLKPASEEEKKIINTITNPKNAAEAYAEGATKDPLSNKAPAKKAVVK